jgi:hypothetical protein
MLFELSNRRALSEFILVAILKVIERKERIEDMIFGSFHQGKALQYVFLLFSIYFLNSASHKQADKNIIYSKILKKACKTLFILSPNKMM